MVQEVKDMNMKENRLKFSDQAKELVSQMSLEEKVHFMSGNLTLEEMRADMAKGHHYNEWPYEAGGNERLGAPSMRFVDGPRGAVTGVGKTTCFPVSMARGAAFDIDLEERIGKAIGKEIRATGGNYFGGVCINLPRNPGWGRSQEVYGEDSFHLGAMGSALSKGVQSEKVIACVKHYAFNSMENARFKVNVKADKRTEREVYLAHFKDVLDSGAASVMSAYNKYQGPYCGHNHYLLTEVLKEEWDFDGFVVSDFVFGIRDTVDAANAGLDIEMNDTKYYGEKLVQAVKDGNVSEEKIDESVFRIIRTLLAFEDAYEETYGEEVLASEDHVALALEAAEKSLTLMKNDKQTLPLDKQAVKSVVVIGKLADVENTGDHGSSRVYPPYVTTPLEGIKNALPNTEVIHNDGSDIELAKKEAMDADAVIFVVGYSHDDEGEYIGEFDDGPGAEFDSVGGDRKESLGLHEDEIELINEVGPINQNSIAVLIGGNMIMIEEWKKSVSSIIMSYYSGMEGGTALANVLFGEVNPSGKLPFVLPFKEEHLPQVDWEAEEIEYEYYHGYTRLDKKGIEPSLPYGYGLSYTTFDISNESFETNDERLLGKVTVKNTGDRSGDEIIQLYIGFKNSSVDRPVKVLRGFSRVSLAAGEEKVVTISTPIEKLKWYNPDTSSWELEHMDYEVYIGTSSSEKDLLRGTVTL